MRILALTTRSPFPLHEGRALRTFNLLKQIGRRHDVHLCTFLQSEDELRGLDHVRAICTDVYAEPLYMNHPRTELALDLGRDLVSRAPLLAVKYRSAKMRSKIREWIRDRRIDLVHLDMLHLGDYADVVAGLPTVLVEHNVEAVILQRRVQTETNPLRRAFLRYQQAKLQSYETRLCSRVDHVVTVSDNDTKLLKAACPGGIYTTVPNGVDTGFFRSNGALRRPSSLVFVGGLSWFPNLDAMRHFCRDILPLVSARVPGVSLTIVGRMPGKEIEREFSRFGNVRLTGTVDDVRPYIDEAAAYVVPLRIGGGTRLKILDALAMGQALVSTSVGCEGLELEAGRHLLVADRPGDFAESVIRVLGDETLARQLGAAGLQRVSERYDWAAIAAVLEQVYQQTVAGAPRRQAARPGG